MKDDSTVCDIQDKAIVKKPCYHAVARDLRKS